ncbi:hypothetical protein K1719_028408 [Acacia pycnantha]|nr:hypothetical protein K1719_028408 [Acacia pycnantha]
MRETYLGRLSIRFECNEPSHLAPIDMFVTTLDPSKEPPIVTACLNFANSTWRLHVPASTEAKDIRRRVEAAEAFRPGTESRAVNCECGMEGSRMIFSLKKE